MTRTTRSKTDSRILIIYRFLRIYAAEDLLRFIKKRKKEKEKMTGMKFEAVRLLSDMAEEGNAFGVTGILDKYGNVIGIVLAVFGLIMLYFAVKVMKMGSFYLEMENHDPIIKDNGFEMSTATVAESRTIEIGGREFSEVRLTHTVDGETYEKWTPDLGFADWVNIEYDPMNPSDFYITDTVEGEQSADLDEDGREVKEESKPVNVAFGAMLILALALLGLGFGFIYDFYFVK